jgi:hypothetical protein
MRYLEKVDVESCRGHKTNETPRAFRLRGVRRDISEATDRWREGGVERASYIMNCFKVRTGDGGEFLLRRDPYDNGWRNRVRPPRATD